MAAFAGACSPEGNAAFPGGMAAFPGACTCGKGVGNRVVVNLSARRDVKAAPMTLACHYVSPPEASPACR